MDGVIKQFSHGEVIKLIHGESITLPQRLYHTFYAENGRGKVLMGEVSKVNDDKIDNQGRFPEMEEDKEVLHYLCFEYPETD